MKNESIITLVEAIKAFYQQHAPAECQRRAFSKATEAQINHFENLIGEPLPADYRTFLLHNDFVFDFRDNFACCSIEHSIDWWTTMAGLLDKGTFDDGRIEHHEAEEFGNWDGEYIQKVWWSKHWVPITEDGCGNLTCIDLAPGKRGKKYQLVSMEVQDGQGPYVYNEYDSFTHYLASHLQYLRAGQYEISYHANGEASLEIDPDIEPGEGPVY